MTPERWQQVERVYHAAMEKPEPDRAAFLENVCASDDDLRREVQSLVAYGQEPNKFIDESALKIVAQALAVGEMAKGEPYPDSDRWIGQRISQYRIVRKLASGGMGEVFCAVRADDEYEKQVALKLVSAGRQSSLFLNRFRNERQILATLDHPNITRLLDGGTTSDGTPYFVMELIDGLPIDEYCDLHHLSVNDRLQLFLQVCSAVQYAHQHLIIHRDIKPGNILVTGDGVPKLMDFGIAKILDENEDADQQNATVTALRVFTPGYASPEQITGEPVTTASDVYSLGVVLYELLTGHCAYRLTRHTPQEIARAICESEPEKPSGAVMHHADVNVDGVRTTSVDVGVARSSSPEKLKKHLRGDLDNIVLMALRKEPHRRYSSVEQFKEDIRRHLESLPVIARNDTVGYRTWKFVRRHQVGVAAAVVVAVVLLIGIAVTAREARVAQAERARAERRFQDVRKLANSLVFDVHDSIKNLPGATSARRLLVSEALQYLDSLSQESLGDISLQRELATAYEKLGDVQGDPMFANLGSTSGAIESYRKALRIRQAIAAAHEHSPSDDSALATAYLKLGFALTLKDDFEAALGAFQQAYPISEKLANTQKNDPQLQETYASVCFSLGHVYADLGDLTHSMEYYRKSAVIREAITAGSKESREFVQTRLAGSYGYMSGVANQQGDIDQALTLETKARDILARLDEADPNNATLHQFLLQAEYWVGYYLMEKGLPTLALPRYQFALAGYQTLFAADPKNMLAMSYLGRCFMSRGIALAAEGKTHQAIESAERANRIFETLHATDATNTYNNLTELAHSRAALADVYSRLAVKPGVSDAVRTDSWRNARAWYVKSLALWLQAKQESPLSHFDSGEPDKITNEINKCDAALAHLSSRHS